jgi:hypothetical protein
MKHLIQCNIGIGCCNATCLCGKWSHYATGLNAYQEVVIAHLEHRIAELEAKAFTSTKDAL